MTTKDIDAIEKVLLFNAPIRDLCDSKGVSGDHLREVFRLARENEETRKRYKPRGKIRARALYSSTLLQELLRQLRCSPDGLSSLQIAEGLNVLNPSTLVAELRANGYTIRREYKGKTQSGRHINIYTLIGEAKIIEGCI
jgi:hypothetical protein